MVLYHAERGLAPGGYVGVDVFFVISGFLITGLLRGELEAGRYRIVEFYERRARRLLPALVAMLVGVTLAALPILMPNALELFGQSVIATALFASNLFFWSESRYFAPDADQLPLLHTWSLAVEEQYYLMFPLLFAGLMRVGRRFALGVIATLAVLSFALACRLLEVEPEQAFYLAHARVWELLLGALLALDSVPAPRSRWLRESLVAAGLAAILAATLGYDTTTAFPGAAAALPCLGAAAIIHAGTGGTSLGSRLLATRAGRRRSHFLFALLVALAGVRAAEVLHGGRAESAAAGHRHRLGVPARLDFVALCRAAIPGARPRAAQTALHPDRREPGNACRRRPRHASRPGTARPFLARGTRPGLHPAP
ncbi:MAG: acyltransferase [Gammaproteobacteria bacterium]|nr:acyltransferase [Gammaproteobacteria bacterium]